ncbi:hypothetical protein SAMN02745704_00581 [Paucidesulfovibrio gracilis DSM 16080]|uniref:Uncharacterized protein n=1 Tax=Paucidesulfovibrio gracilis DSM 16080 TaxID=1121449 RepID=A0A1T4W9T9_9BACT|nr:hypothetical protein [Paucidesulfovibrio gracilis]SKA74052.1 hypothetical protein SAMN02745704_00581 [Paucidesulfovibrio gracilis DSM 16080]
MQQRYCQCGAAFLVAYLPGGPGLLRAHIVAANQAGIHTVHRCPCCGQPVDINSLR